MGISETLQIKIEISCYEAWKALRGFGIAFLQSDIIFLG